MTDVVDTPTWLSPSQPSPVCRLGWDAGALLATLVDGGRVVERIRLPAASPTRIEDLVAAHRSSFDDGPNVTDRRPFELWTSATERFLAEVGGIVAPLLDLVNGWARVGLVLDDPELGWVPWEASAAPGLPALFECCPIYRHCPICPHCPAPPSSTALDAGPRRFAVDICLDDTLNLAGLAVEGLLVASSYRSLRPGRSSGPAEQRVVHVAGHDPDLGSHRFGADERAHVILSGCTSLPAALPEGVASATASLWPIDDQANVITMAALHGRLGLGIGPLEALRQAQLLQRALPPTAWAAYVHIGDPT